MEQYFLMWALILIVGTLVFYVIMKSLLKTLATFLFIVMLFIVITATLTYSDFNNLKTKLEKMETAYVFEDNSIPLFGMVASQETTIKLEIEGEYENEYEKIRKDYEYYRIIIIKSPTYDEIPENIESETKTALLETLKDESALFTERAYAFDTLNNAVKEQGAYFMFKKYKEGNIMVYPRTMFFRIISIIPDSWLETATSSSSEE